MKKIAIAMILILAAGGLTFESVGGMGWLQSTGLLGSERQLRGAVEGYWQARVDDDLARMADFVHPDQEGMYDPGMLKTLKFELAEITIDGDRATATVDVTFRLDHPTLSHVERAKTLHDRWVRHEGAWYREYMTL